MRAVLALATSAVLSVGSTIADEAPISGTVKAVDAQAQTLTLKVAAKGKTREVTIYMRPGAKVVRFARASEPGQTGFVVFEP